MTAIDQAAADKADKEAQRALEMAISSMPDGPEKDQMLADFVRDYPGHIGALDSELDQLGDEYDSILDGAPEMRSGPEGNPFARDVAASPLEFLGQGLREYGNRQARADLYSQREGELGRKEGLQEFEVRQIMDRNREADAAAMGMDPGDYTSGLLRRKERWT